MRHFVIGLALINIVLLMPTDSRADDRQIAERIMQTLDVQKRQGKLRGFGVNLEVESGNVWLKGHVSSRQQQYLILDVARRVPGVKQVVNDIEIKTQQAVASQSPAASRASAATPARQVAATAPQPSAPQPSAPQPSAPQPSAPQPRAPQPRAQRPTTRAAQPVATSQPARSQQRTDGGLLSLFKRSQPQAAQPAVAQTTPATLARSTPATAMQPTSAKPAQVARSQPQSGNRGVFSLLNRQQTNAVASSAGLGAQPTTRQVSRQQTAAQPVAQPTAQRGGLLANLLKRPEPPRSNPSTRPLTRTNTNTRGGSAPARISTSSQPKMSAMQVAQGSSRPTQTGGLLGRLFSKPAVAAQQPATQRVRPGQTTVAAKVDTSQLAPAKLASQTTSSAALKPAAIKPQAKTLAAQSQPSKTITAAAPSKSQTADATNLTDRLAKLQHAFLTAAGSTATASRANLTAPAKAQESPSATTASTTSDVAQAALPQPVATASVPQPKAAGPAGIPVAIVGQLSPQTMGTRPVASQMPVAFAPARGASYAQAAQQLAQPGQGAPIPAYTPGTGGVVPAHHDHPQMPNYAWPSYAPHPNYGAVTYPRQYSPTAWPYIGPFYPYPQVPLGWRKVSLRWKDGWWWLDFKDKNHGYRY